MGLNNGIATLYDGDDRASLDRGRTLETLGGETSEIIASVTFPSVPVSVDTAEKFWLEIHVVKTKSGSVNCVQCRTKDAKYELIDDLIPVGFYFGILDILDRFSVTPGLMLTFECARLETAGPYWSDMIVCG